MQNRSWELSWDSLGSLGALFEHFLSHFAPKWAQKSPKVVQVAPKRGPKWTLKAKLAPRVSQRPPDGHFWTDFSGIFDEF